VINKFFLDSDKFKEKKIKLKLFRGFLMAAFLLIVFGVLGFIFRSDLKLRTNASTYGSAVLVWDANSEPDLAGYKIYYDTSSHSGSCPEGYGANVVDVGNVTTYTIGTHPGDPDLVYGQTYYFSITAYDDASPANESDCSSEVSKLINAPTITNVTSDKTDGTYDTNAVIDIDVTFSEAVTSTGVVIVTLETGATDRTCTFTITNSTTGTCNYTVQAGDSSSDLNVNSVSGTIKDQGLNEMTNFAPTTNLSTNKNLIINGVSPDTIPPDRSNGSPTGKLSSGTKSKTISLTTNENATCKYATLSGVDYSSMTSTFTTTGGTSHSESISGLSNNHSYNYFVRCQDESLNSNLDDYVISFSVNKKSSGSSSSLKSKKSTKYKISNTPKNLGRGQIAIQSGKKFSKNSFVKLYFSRPLGGYYAPQIVKTSITGTFAISYKIPWYKPSGKYTWYAVDGKTGSKSNKITYTVK
jgi:hypothetical protein